MRILLDTNAWLWITGDSSRLGPAARQIVLADENEIVLSAVSAWEISIKWALGKLHLPVPPNEFAMASIRESGFTRLDISFEDVVGVAVLPAIHNDPFDRLLIAQARAGNVPILTGDPVLSRYGIATIDATI